MARQLYRVEASHFVAGFETGDRGCIVHAAPILRWSIGKHIRWFRGYAKRKQWELMEL